MPDRIAPPPAAPINLRHARRRLGKSLDQAAAEIGVTKRVLHHAERGAVLTRPASQLAIATYYGLDVVTQWPDPYDARHASEAAA